MRLASRVCTGGDGGAARSATAADQPAADLVNRQFTVDKPDRLWLTDIAEHSTIEGKVYCAAVMDAYSRRIIGWSIADHRRVELVIDALGMSTLRRKPAEGGTILHSDHGPQYTAWAFGKRLEAAGILPSMGTMGDCYDNSMIESFWGTMQLELLDTKSWQTRAGLASLDRVLGSDLVLAPPGSIERGEHGPAACLVLQIVDHEALYMRCNRNGLSVHATSAVTLQMLRGQPPASSLDTPAPWPSTASSAHRMAPHDHAPT